MREFEVSAKDDLLLSVCVFDHDNPKGIIQIIHGAKEHYRRYLNFAKFLNDSGYVVLLSDNRGHGHSVNKKYPLGHMENIKEISDDQFMLSQMIKDIYPNKDLILFGHSFGTCIARKYLQDHDDYISKLIMSGTVYYHNGVNQVLGVGRIIGKKNGLNSYNKFLSKIGDIDGDKWVVKNPMALEKYKNDPLCKYKYTIGAILTVWESVSEFKNFTAYKVNNPQLPIGIFSGQEDPITGGKKGIKSTIKILNHLGYKNIHTKTYADMKHEILNEVDNMTVYKDILNFIEI